MIVFRARASRGLVPGRRTAGRSRGRSSRRRSSKCRTVSLSAAGKSRSSRDGAVAGPRRRSGGCGLAGRRVTVADSSGRVLHTSTTNGEVTVQRRLASRQASYTVTVELPQFIAAVQQVTVPATGSLPALRFVLTAGGFSEDVVVTGRRVGDPNRRHAAEGRGRRCDGYRTHRGGGPDRRPEEECGGRRHPVRGRALRHRHSRVPPAVLGHQQALTAAHRRPAVRRDQSRDPAPGRHRSHRGPQGRRVVGLRLVGDGRRRQRHHATVARQDWRHGAVRRRQLRDLGVLRTRRWQRVVACRLRPGRQRVRPARRLSDGQRRGPARRPATRRTTARPASVSDLGSLAPRSPWRRLSRARHHDARRPCDRHQFPGPEGPRAIESGPARLGTRRDARACVTAYHADDSGHTVNVTTTNPLDRPFLPYLVVRERSRAGPALQVKDVVEAGRAPTASSSASTTRESRA